MNNNLQVTLERNGKRVIVLFRSDDLFHNLRGGPGLAKIRWGSGAMWTVVKIEEAAN